MKTPVLIIVCIIACFSGLIVASLAWQILNLPQWGWINPESAYQMYVDEIPYDNGTALDWGNVTVGYTYYVNFTVANVGTTTETVYLHVSDVPYNCTESWMGNGTLLAPNTYVAGDLTLTVGVNAPVGLFNITSYVTTG